MSGFEGFLFGFAMGGLLVNLGYQLWMLAPLRRAMKRWTRG